MVKSRAFDFLGAAGRYGAWTTACVPTVATAMRALLILALLAAAPTPRQSLADGALAHDSALDSAPDSVQGSGSAAGPLRPTLQLAPPPLEAPPGQRLRSEQDCGSCHRIEDRRPWPTIRGDAVMT